MATKRKRGEAWEYTFKKAGVLEKPIYMTFQSEEEGDAFGRRLEALLDRGIVPEEYQPTSRLVTITNLVRVYLRDAPVKQKDRDVLGTVMTAVGSTSLVSINAAWVDAWITRMKREDRLSPATIRAKVGALARCCDWGMRKELLMMPDHPLRTLPDGYAQYTEKDEKLAGAKKSDHERERRLEHGEYERIMATLDRGVLARKQRPYQIQHVPELRTLFVLGLESAMRLREMYTLTVDQVDVPRRTIFLDRTKNGDKRQVPLTSVAAEAMRKHMETVAAGPVFPWWDGDRSPRNLRITSNFLSKLFLSVFEDAGCDGLHFHDLRHEATSRLFERTQLSESEIMKVTGHKTHRMMMRYANLRASDLATKLW